MDDKYKVTEEFVRELGLRILNTKKGCMIVSVDEYLNLIGNEDERKLSYNIYRSIEESINKVSPANYYFKVNGTNKGQDFKISIIPKKPWILKEE